MTRLLAFGLQMYVNMYLESYLAATQLLNLALKEPGNRRVLLDLECSPSFPLSEAWRRRTREGPFEISLSWQSHLVSSYHLRVVVLDRMDDRVLNKVRTFRLHLKRNTLVSKFSIREYFLLAYSTLLTPFRSPPPM